MKMTKKFGSLIALLLLVTTFNSYSMEKEPRKWTELSAWEQIVGGVLLGTAAIKTLWQSNKSFEFTQLPKDIQNQIILLLSLNTTATSLKEAAKTINSLAQVNKELNTLINDPKFCLKLIKRLAEKFDCSDQEATKALKTQEAKRRLELQDQLYLRCSTPLGIVSPLKNIPRVEILCEQGVDLNFTYDTLRPKFFFTPLMIASSSDNEILKQLCSIGNNLININHRDNDGDTALMIVLAHSTSSFRCEKNIKILLNAGANPEIANNMGRTPLQTAQELWDSQPEIADLIKDAIDKKRLKS